MTARNRYRDGIVRGKGAVRAILKNPRYTGHQVWAEQRKDEVLLDVRDVSLGYTSKLRWNDRDKWVWWISPCTKRWSPRTPSTRRRRSWLVVDGVTQYAPRCSSRPYIRKGCLICGVCDRRM